MYLFQIPLYNPENVKNKLPERGKNRAQKQTEAALPQEDSGKEAAAVGHPGICAAKTEDQIDPAAEKGGHEQQVTQPPGAEIPQRAVKKSQAAA